MKKIFLFAFFSALSAFQTYAAEPLAAEKVKELRAAAKEAIGVIPEKMPGAEKDTPELISLGEKLFFEKKQPVAIGFRRENIT